MPPPVLLATASYDRTIRFWEAPSGICIRTLNFQDSQVNCLCTSPDKAFLAAAGHKHIRLYDISASSQVPASAIEAHTSNVTALVYFTDGKYLMSASEDGLIKVWDTRTMVCKRKFVVKAPVNTLALHPDQTTVLCGDQSGRLSVWMMKKDECVQELVPEGDVGIRSIAVSQVKEDLACAANNSGEVFVLSLAKDDQGLPRLSLTHTFKAHNKYILKCALSPDSKLLATCSADYTVGLWFTSVNDDPAISPWSCYRSLQSHLRWVWDCAFSGDGNFLVTASSDSTGKLWDIAKGTDAVTFNGHHKPVTCIVVDDRPNPNDTQS
eukprot:TRINITY_DN2886_c0_g1_i1.p1 TRINITY_DN2886_c0_g1~~TRINITY_DN2886_c0_g1_i1.p1  ORF type:complete len:323 (+),score=45.21 TRINITY_DN2886_c0_g1_i1:138-1106(+)